MLSCEERFAAYRTLIPDFAAFCAALRTPPVRCLRVNTLRTTPDVVCTLLARYGYRATQVPFAPELLLVEDLERPGTLPAALLGYYHPQALSSALIAHVLAPQPGERVCDLCAAPGSKTTHLAQLMRNQGLIVANDPFDKRLSLLQNNVKRLGVCNVITTRYSGQNFPLRCTFDRVLVDAPCSGEGNYRWDARGRLRGYKPTPADLPRLQRQLLLRGFDLLRPGGTLVYATCTYNPAENEAVVQSLLEQRPAQLEPISLPVPHSPGVRQWHEERYDASLELCWRLYPHQLNSVGFFVARLRRRA
ncbi:MAG: SAM-dependent methyltransferase [Candidatus Tectimicrobiota bacterium]|nr:MAG: SAM-dependent methyltransferase [Candidatus Tectomicrobia bacterium]